MENCGIKHYGHLVHYAYNDKQPPLPNTLYAYIDKHPLTIQSLDMTNQMTNQQQGDHGLWPEANVGQQYRKRPDRLVHQILTVPATINPEKRPAVGS